MEAPTYFIFSLRNKEKTFQSFQFHSVKFDVRYVEIVKNNFQQNLY